MNNKVALVTGASSGMGRETVLELKKRGFIVYGGARRIKRMNGTACYAYYEKEWLWENS